MLKSEIDRKARRTIVAHAPVYDRMIGKPENWEYDQESSGDFSNTYDTMQFIKSGVIKYHKDFAEVANSLKAHNIEQTVRNNYDWLYRHFQYVLDEGPLNQKLYTPKRAWAERFKGFDCKTFSLLASILLYNQGIEHKIRKVKQTTINPDYWSHVFVVVPHKGRELYIDATRHSNNINVETIIEKYDLNVKNLKHQWLGNPGCGCGGKKKISFSGASLGSPASSDTIYIPDTSTQKINFNEILAGIKGLNLNSIKNFINSLACKVPSAYDENLFKSNIDKLTAIYNQLLTDINQAVANKNDDALAIAVQDYIGMTTMFTQTFEAKRASKNWNKCSSDNFTETIKFCRWFSIDIALLMLTFLKKYYDVYQIKDSKKHYSNEGREQSMGIWGLHVTPWIVYSPSRAGYRIKPNVTEIPVFEVTSYVFEQIKSNKPIDLANLINSLTHIAAVFTPGSTNTGTGTNTGTTFTPNTGNTQQTAEFNNMLGWALIIGVTGHFVAQNLKNKK